MTFIFVSIAYKNESSIEEIYGFSGINVPEQREDKKEVDSVEPTS